MPMPCGHGRFKVRRCWGVQSVVRQPLTEEGFPACSVPPAADAAPTAALYWLDERLALAVEDFRASHAGEAAGQPFRGLFIDDADLARLLAVPPLDSPLQSTRHRMEPPPIDGWPELAALRDRYGLDGFDLGTLLIAAAPELDLRYQRIYAFLQDDVTRKRPTVDMILSLLTGTPARKLARRDRFQRTSALLRHHLVELIPESPDTGLLSCSVHVDPRIVDRLLGQALPDPRLQRYCALSTRCADLARTQSRPAQHDALRQLLESLDPRARPRTIIQLCGAPGSGRLETLRSVALALERPVLTVCWDRVVAEHSVVPPALAHWILREAERVRSLLHVEVASVPADRAAFDDFLSVLAHYHGRVVLSTTAPLGYEPHCALGDRILLHTLSFSGGAAELRDAVLEAALAEHGLSLASEERLQFTDRFVLSTHQIATVVQAAAAEAAVRRNGQREPVPIGYPDLARHAKAHGRDRLRGLAVHIVPKYRWHDLVLPEDTERQLRELLGRIRNRRRVMHDLGFADKLSLGHGITALLAGPSGVGKTMAAEVLAREVGLELFKADLSTLVSKYIGETAKNLSTLFAAARDANCILFCDEADAICGKRGAVDNAQDRYAHVEIAHLLQKIEEYDGIVLLATNLPQNFDDAFSRRISSKVFFPFPDHTYRERIWLSVWPERVTLDAGIDWAAWARAFELSGGNITNIALAATYLAAEDGTAVTDDVLLRGLQREYQKLGRWVPLDQLERELKARR
jgi:hypothetical protein